MTPDANKAHMLEFTSRVLNDKDLDAADALVAEDFLELDPLPGQGPGREGLKQAIAGLFQAFPDMHWTVHEQVAEGDKVVSRFTWTGTHRAPFMGVPPTGRSVAVSGVVIDRIVDGRMQDSRILMDTLSLMQQLGAIPGP